MNMRKYLTVLRLNFLKQLEFRVNNIVWLLVGILPSLISYAIWRAVYQERSEINGLKQEYLLSYFLLSAIMWYFVGGTVNRVVGDSIKDGRLNSLLIKPMHPMISFIFYEQGWKALSLLVTSPALVILLYISRVSFPVTTFEQGLCLLLATFGGAVIFALWDIIIGMSAFFVVNMSPVNRLNRIGYALLSGQIIPIALFPSWINRLNDLLFFRYTFAFPLQVIFEFGQIRFFSLFIRQCIWIGILIVLFNFVYKRGIRHYEAVGT